MNSAGRGAFGLRLGVGEAVGLRPGLDDRTVKVSRSTMAVLRRLAAPRGPQCRTLVGSVPPSRLSPLPSSGRPLHGCHPRRRDRRVRGHPGPAPSPVTTYAHDLRRHGRRRRTNRRGAVRSPAATPGEDREHSTHRSSSTEPPYRSPVYNLPVLISALLLRIAESRLQFSGWTLSQRLPLPSSLPTWSSRRNHSSALLILLGWISSSRA